MPNLRIEVFGETEASLNTKRRQTSTTPMNGVLGYEVSKWADYQGQVPKNTKAYHGRQRKGWIHFVLNECGHVHHALVAGCFDRAMYKENN